MIRDARQYSAADLLWPVVAVIVVTVLVVVAGVAATLAVAGVWALFSLPGWILFRRRVLDSPVSAVVASVIGLAGSLTALAAIGSLLGSFSPLLVVVVPASLAVIAWRYSVAIPETTPARGAGSRFAVVPPLMALALALPPLLMVGLPVGDSLHYTAFFNADFFKHTAHVESIARTGLPPEDAFAAGHRLAYYWVQYLIPAAAVRLTASAVEGDRAMLAAGLVQTTILGIVLFAAARRVTRRPRMAALACALGLLSLSLDGLTQQIRDLPVSPLLRMMTINQSPPDLTLLAGARSAIANVTFIRLNLYTPQHQLAVIVLATWIALVPRRGVTRTAVADAARLALILPLPGISLMTGGVAAVLMAAGEWIRARRMGGRAAAAGALIAAFALCFATGMLDRTAASGDPFLRFLTGPRPPLWERLLWAPIQIGTGFGVTSLLSTAVLWRFRRFPLPVGLAIFTPAAVLLLVEMLPGPRLTMEAQYKTSYILNFGFLLGSAVWLEMRCWRRNALVVGAACAVAAAGLIAPIHDVLWFTNLASRKTTAIPREDLEALRWIRAATPPTLVFQQSLEAPTILGGRDAWVPIFGARSVRMAPRSPWATDEDLQRASRLLVPGTPAEERLALARELRVDALFVSRTLQPAGFQALSANLETSGWIPVRRTPGTGVWLRPR